MRRFLMLTVVAVILAAALRVFVLEGIYVASGSMEPTLSTGQTLFLEKVTIKFRGVKYNDIVVFPSPERKGRDLIKRVIALPGDTIEIHEKVVYRNGSVLEEEYVQYTRRNEILLGDNIEQTEVPKGMVFVMGDNRDESKDSRDWRDPETGERLYFIPIHSIKGKVFSLY